MYENLLKSALWSSEWAYRDPAAVPPSPGQLQQLECKSPVTPSEQVLALAELSAERGGGGIADTGVDVWSDANRHLLTLHSLDHLNSWGWQGKWASLDYKSPNLDWLSLCPGLRADTSGPPLTRCGRRARHWSDTSEKAGCRSLVRCGGRRGEEEGRSGYFEATGEGKCQIWLGSRLVLEYAWH